MHSLRPLPCTLILTVVFVLVSPLVQHLSNKITDDVMYNRILDYDYYCSRIICVKIMSSWL